MGRYGEGECYRCSQRNVYVQQVRAGIYYCLRCIAKTKNGTK